MASPPALSSILNMADEVAPFFGITQADNPADYALLNMLRRWLENQARRYVGHGITENDYVNEYQRKSDIGSYEGAGMWELVGDKVLWTGRSYANDHANILQLDNGFVRSISALREDSSAYFGQQAGDFAASTALVAGTDYFLEVDTDEFSKSGRLIRIGRNWSSAPGTIRISYTAGLTSEELEDEYSFVKQALLDDLAMKFQFAKSRQGSSSGGPIRSESVGGEYRVEYAVADDRRGTGLQDLSSAARASLMPIRRINLT